MSVCDCVGREIPEPFPDTLVTTPPKMRGPAPTEHGSPDTSPKPDHDFRTPSKRPLLSPLAKSVGKNLKTPRKMPELTEEELRSQVPDIRENAYKPTLGQFQLSRQAIRMRSQRIFQRRKNGSLKVSETVFNEWHEKGARRAMLEQIFHQCGYDPAP